MINDLLEFSQLARDESEIKQTDLNKILENVKTDLELLISQKKAVIHAEALPVIEAIPVQINQLFYNLLNNALKFSKENEAPVIRFTVSQPRWELTRNLPGHGNTDYIQVSVSDNGIGFDQEYAEKIFAMFQRLTTERSGTGIGLALCKKIVENHKGYISATSTPGIGTKFDILLPKRQ